jgi:2-dehydropantoate 2-reductase
MRHAVLGAGGVGTFLAGALARAGRNVLLLMREESLARYPGVVHVASAVLGNFEAEVPAAPALEQPVDVVWITTKAYDLAEALERVPVATVEESVVVPLLNGLDHVELLRERFGPTRVLPASIAIESERSEPGVVRQLSGFAAVVLSPAPKAERLCSELVPAGIAASIGDSEAGVLWGKLAILAPIALTTTLHDSPFGGVMADPDWRSRLEACTREVAAAANGDGVGIDADALVARMANVPPDLRSSMQKDREAGKPIEIDAIGGSVLRASARHGLEAPATRALVDGIRAAVTQ